MAWQEVSRAGLHRVHGKLDGAECGDHDDSRIGLAPPHFVQHLDPVEFGHSLIQQHQIEA